GSVAKAELILEQGERSIRRISRGTEVDQERSGASGGIFIPRVDGPRSRANPRVSEAAPPQKKRPPTQCLASKTGKRYAVKRFAPFRCREIGITPVHIGICVVDHGR